MNQPTAFIPLSDEVRTLLSLALAIVFVCGPVLAMMLVFGWASKALGVVC